MLTVQEREQRRGGVGGSDVAAILGLSKYTTSYELYYEKIDDTPLEEETPTDPQHFGNVLEDTVANEFSRRSGKKVQRRNDMIYHPEFKFMFANIDRKVVGERSVLECKTSGQFMARDWGPDGSDEIPDYYRVQLEHYFNCTGYDFGYLAVLIGGNDFRTYPIERDVELSEMIVQACKQFWKRVEDREPPDLDFYHRSTKEFLAKLYPGTNGETIMLPENLVHWQKVREDAEARKKEDEAVIAAVKNRISAAMGEAAVGIIPGTNVKYTRRKVTKKPYTVTPDPYIDMRAGKYQEKK